MNYCIISGLTVLLDLVIIYRGKKRTTTKKHFQNSNNSNFPEKKTKFFKCVIWPHIYVENFASTSSYSYYYK